MLCQCQHVTWVRPGQQCIQALNLLPHMACCQTHALSPLLECLAGQVCQADRVWARVAQLRDHPVCGCEVLLSRVAAGGDQTPARGQQLQHSPTCAASWTTTCRAAHLMPAALAARSPMSESSTTTHLHTPGAARHEQVAQRLQCKGPCQLHAGSESYDADGWQRRVQAAPSMDLQPVPVWLHAQILCCQQVDCWVRLHTWPKSAPDVHQ